MSESILVPKSKKFAIRILKCCDYLDKTNIRHALVDQIQRSGTSIGANIAESVFAQSTADYITKLHIALKEANETRYWLGILHEMKYLNDEIYSSMLIDNEELIKLLVSIIKSCKNK
jgi:four helix bundle protein